MVVKEIIFLFTAAFYAAYISGSTLPEVFEV